MAPPRAGQESAPGFRAGKRVKAKLRAELAAWIQAKEGRALRHPLLQVWATRKRLAGLGVMVSDLYDDEAEALDFIEAVYIGLQRKGGAR